MLYVVQSVKGAYSFYNVCPFEGLGRQYSNLVQLNITVEYHDCL